MAENIKSITEVRQNLPNFSLDAEQNMERYVITNQGKPQSVLVGYQDYQKMKAATDFVIKPEALASLRRGLAQYQEGIRLTEDQVREKLLDNGESHFPVAKVKRLQKPLNQKKPYVQIAAKKVKFAKPQAELKLAKSR